MQAIKDLKEKFGGSTLFGNEKDDSFKGSIGTMYKFQPIGYTGI